MKRNLKKTPIDMKIDVNELDTHINIPCVCVHKYLKMTPMDMQRDVNTLKIQI